MRWNEAIQRSLGWARNPVWNLPRHLPLPSRLENATGSTSRQIFKLKVSKIDAVLYQLNIRRNEETSNLFRVALGLFCQSATIDNCIGEKISANWPGGEKRVGWNSWRVRSLYYRSFPSVSNNHGWRFYTLWKWLLASILTLTNWIVGSEKSFQCVALLANAILAALSQSIPCLQGKLDWNFRLTCSLEKSAIFLTLLTRPPLP